MPTRNRPCPGPSVRSPSSGMGDGIFTVAVIGPPWLTDYPAVRDALDSLLSGRLPAVHILTASGPVAYLAAAYASARRITHEGNPGDWLRADAEEPRAAAIVRRAAGVVVFQAEGGPDRFAALVIARAARGGVPVRVVAVKSPAEGFGGKRGKSACRGGW